jgi:hypothetical protein
MTRAARQLLDDAMALPEDERLGLATEIIASVGGPVDPGWDEAWLAELERREATDALPDEDWVEVRKRVFARFTYA